MQDGFNVPEEFSNLTIEEMLKISRAWNDEIKGIKRMIPLDRSQESHDPYTAVERSPLSPEEIYFIIRFAERMDYSKAIKRLTPGYPFSVWREWLVWIGGWERAELSQWDRGLPAWDVWRDRVDWLPDEPIWKAYIRRLTAFNDPFPLSILGHFVTFYGWGVTVSFERLQQGWGHLTLSEARRGDGFSKLYWSPNGTPQHERARIFWSKHKHSE